MPLHCNAMQEDGKFDRKPTELHQLPESQCCPTHKPLNLIWVNYLEISNSQHGRHEARRRRRDGGERCHTKMHNRIIASFSRHTLQAKHKKSISNVRSLCRGVGNSLCVMLVVVTAEDFICETLSDHNPARQKIWRHLKSDDRSTTG